MLLVDFTDVAAILAWQPVNDAATGGVSSGARRWPPRPADAAHGDRVDGLQCQAGFVPADAWQPVLLPLADFVASFRGRPQPSAIPLEAAEIRTPGPMICDRRQGPSRLQVARLEAV
jgi:hypothetical protein